MKQKAITENQIREAMESCNCSVDKTCELLGLTRGGVYWVLKRYSLKVVNNKHLTKVK